MPKPRGFYEKKKNREGIRFVYECAQSFGCVWLCDSVDCSPPGSSVHGFPRQEYWSGLPFPSPGESFQLRDWTHVSCIARWVVYHWASREAQTYSYQRENGGEEGQIRINRCTDITIYKINNKYLLYSTGHCIQYSIINYSEKNIYMNHFDVHQKLTCSVAKLCLTLLWAVDCRLPGSSVHEISSKSTGVTCHFLLQRIFPTQASNPRLLHWQIGSLLPRHQEVVRN